MFFRAPRPQNLGGGPGHRLIMHRPELRRFGIDIANGVRMPRHAAIKRFIHTVIRTYCHTFIHANEENYIGLYSDILYELYSLNTIYNRLTSCKICTRMVHKSTYI